MNNTKGENIYLIKISLRLGYCKTLCINETERKIALFSIYLTPVYRI